MLCVLAHRNHEAPRAPPLSEGLTQPSLKQPSTPAKTLGFFIQRYDDARVDDARTVAKLVATEE
jgi:hypothetical protein